MLIPLPGAGQGSQEIGATSPDVTASLLKGQNPVKWIKTRGTLGILTVLTFPPFLLSFSHLCSTCLSLFIFVCPSWTPCEPSSSNWFWSTCLISVFLFWAFGEQLLHLLQMLVLRHCCLRRFSPVAF